MALITRLTRLFKADFHAVLDSIEEPDIQLKQAIREMAFELQQEQQAVVLLEHKGERLETQLQQAEKKLVSLEEELNLCFDAGKDDLARDLIRRKLETGSFQESVSKRLGQVNSKLKKCRSNITEHQQQLDDMKQKLDLLVNEPDPGSSESGVSPSTICIRSEDIEIAFLREKQLRAKS